MFVEDVHLVGIRHVGPGHEELQEGVLENVDDDWVGGGQDRVAHEVVQGAQGLQGAPEVHVLRGDAELVDINEYLKHANQDLKDHEVLKPTFLHSLPSNAPP